MGLIRITKLIPAYDRKRAFTAVYVNSNGIATHGVLNNGKFEYASYVTVSCDSNLSCEPEVGQLWSIEGEYIQNEFEHGTSKKRVHQYKHPELEIRVPRTDEAFIQFIASSPDFKGVGETTMRNLFAAIEDARELLLKGDVNTLKHHLAPKRLKVLVKGLEKYENLAETREMARLGIPLHIQMRLIRIHKKEAIEQIRQNPYVLITFGMAFKQVDDIARSDKFEIKMDDERRLAGAVEDSLLKIFRNNGDTYTNLSRVKKSLRSRLGNQFDLIDKALTLGANGKNYIIRDRDIFLTSYYMNEIVISKRFRKLASKPQDEWSSDHGHVLSSKLKELDYQLSDEQINAVSTSMRSHISCIVGGAGTGKTTVIRTALKALNELGFTIIPVALSGRAAKRMHESIEFPTSTIARLLREEPEEHRCRKVLVIDEAGMIDLQSMFKLVLHHHPSVRILLVGDSQQLSPIGAGKVLEDTINSNSVPVSRLSIVRRTGEGSFVPAYSTSIANGEIPDYLTTKGIVFKQTLEIAKAVVDQLKSTQGDKIVIAPTKALVEEINQLAQSTLNPNGTLLTIKMFGQDDVPTLFRVGDPIIFTENNYQERIQNGSLGLFISSDGDFGKVRLEDGTEKELTRSLFDSMELAYAITLHKAQGSQFDTVIIALKHREGFTDRKWLYTAVTRVVKELYIFGKKEDFDQMVATSNQRKTQLKSLLDKTLVLDSF